MPQWDAEVRDKALGLVEDFGRGLPMLAYKEAYEGLLVRGRKWSNSHACLLMLARPGCTRSSAARH